MALSKNQTSASGKLQPRVQLSVSRLLVYVLETVLADVS
jgi:hypothetical protein